MDSESKKGIAIFINAILVISFFLYYQFYDELKQISKMIIDATPSFIFVIGIVLIYAKDQSVLKQRRIKNEIEKTFIVTKYDIYLIMLLMFAVFLGIALAPMLYSMPIDGVDIVQATAGLLALYFIRIRYFHYKFISISKDEYAIDRGVSITYYDTMLMDALCFLAPLIIVFIPGIIFKNLFVTDIVQAVISFFSIYWINQKYFQL